MDSGDEWCLVDDEENYSRKSSFEAVDIDSVDPVVKPTAPIQTISIQPAPIELEDIVLTLLPDSVDYSIMSRDKRLSLLSSSHQQSINPASKPLPKIAFSGPFTRMHPSYPSYLRSLVQSHRIKFTKVMPFCKDQATQMEESPLPLPISDPRTLLSSSLARTLSVSQQLHAKSQQCERLELQNIKLQTMLAATDIRFHTLETRITELEGYVQQTETRCVICWSRPVSVKLEPCGHYVLCSECSLYIDICPLDRSQVADRVLLYGLAAYKNKDKAE